MQKKLKKNKQNFQGEITSGFIVKLEKLTQENIRLGRQQQQKERIEKLKKLIEKDMEIISKTKKDYDNSIDDPAIQKLILIRWSKEVELCAKKIEELKKYE